MGQFKPGETFDLRNYMLIELNLRYIKRKTVLNSNLVPHTHNTHMYNNIINNIF